MIYITVKFTARPEHVDNWLELVDDFTKATRSEPGNIFFEWSRSVDDPHQFVLVEAFRDTEAATAHVNSLHFARGTEAMSYAVATIPQIVSTEIPGQDGWSEMGEVRPRTH
ncbi:antibiotic biosynthesis monooxygenase [Rhodococcus sp. FH8]|uniref:Quinol monooxygenase n=1 Tax=Rhodococcus baikonurensis TaxID=172041 RepID=A0ABV5XFH1_9NOCA|nr:MULTISPECIES: putative quinol monooxygenase [Rhodococcus]MBW0286019.1 antibiotic biosynthesis monooxygenase [Rhodococcus sp. FH8]MCZ4548242.1 putative quinol monooxygenase [Rhodococcus qingshengii]OKA06552.1 antibiotic biosynthesis monooxygenase [Rhodococcus erythropolis]REK78801.1 antibiotic biosynthesis monooxygenase [Rhodococcus erythropolis]